MTSDAYDLVAARLIAAAASIEASKRPGYTAGHEDVLHNFKTVAERIGITPGQVLAVYMLKHVDAIVSILAKPDLPVSEAAIGRFADLVNYCKLGYALVEERASQSPESAPERPRRARLKYVR
jgi:hypothetical protein